MTTDSRCVICRKPDVRRMAELGWNAKMSAPQIATAMALQFTAAQFLKHLRDHVESGAGMRAIPVEDARPVKDRVLELQRMQLDEIERRIAMAQEQAVEWNTAMANVEGFESRDWSYYFDLLDKDNQAAISSILKAQGLSDKREAGPSTKVDIFRLMMGGGDGLAPKRLIEGDGETIEGEAVDVTPEDEA
jgi:hypothetical protein